jgi:hypothetical protein
MIQQDLIEQRAHPDAVSFGGWAIDLHPADGVYSKTTRPARRWHSARACTRSRTAALYSRNLSRTCSWAGGIISVSACGVRLDPRDVRPAPQRAGHRAWPPPCARSAWVRPRDLMDAPLHASFAAAAAGRRAAYIPGVVPAEPGDLAAACRGHREQPADNWTRLASCGRTVSLESPRAMLVPVAAGAMPRVSA